MKDYKNFVSLLAKEKIDKEFLNSDKEHALIVLTELFKNAQMDVRIFAGSLCREVANAPEYIEALSDFIERGGNVRILLNRVSKEDAKKSSLFKRLAYYVSEGKSILIKSTVSKPYLTTDLEKKEIHFTVADDNAYRIETNIDLRTAECNYNNPIMSKNITSFFDTIFEQEESECIDLMALFNLNK